MPVHLTSKFFKNERQNYSDWQLALWRELFQNAVDQDAQQITIGLTKGINGVVNLSFSDDGPGMSRDVLHNVYFALGESTKDQDPTKIGGMGRARLLTCFSMQSYRIYSQDYEVASAQPMVDGTRPAASGSDCESYPHAWTDGCKLVLEVDDTDLAALQIALNRFLYESRISAKLIVNGQRVFGQSLNAGRHIRDLETNGGIFAKIWVNKSIKTKRVIVRVNGVSMFTTSTNADAQVVVELEPSVSRVVLTASRDGLHYRFQESLNRFLNELAVDTTSALRSRFGRRTTVTRGGGMRTVHAPRKAGTPTQPYSFINAPIATAFYEPSPKRVEPSHDGDTFIEARHDLDPFSEEALRAANPAFGEETFYEWMVRTFGDIYLFDETESPAIRKVLPAYNPSNWTLQIKSSDGKTYRRGGNFMRVLLLWHTAINYAIEVSLGVLEKTEVPFAVGFVFPNDGKGADHREQDGGHVFSLCPIDANGKLKYKITDPRDLKTMMTLAKHEVTHIGVSWHGERFSSLREAIDVEFDNGECGRRMTHALKNAKII